MTYRRQERKPARGGIFGSKSFFFDSGRNFGYTYLMISRKGECRWLFRWEWKIG